MASDTQVDITIRNKVRNISCRQENKRNGQILNQSDVETVRTLELDIGTAQ